MICFLCNNVKLKFLFNTLVNLSFVSQFTVNTSDYQDYFSFNGNNTTANLSRTNKTINLHVTSHDDYELY